MLLLRLIGVLVAIVIGAGIVTWLLTGDRRYLRFAGRLARWALIFVLFVLALMLLERVLVIL